MSTLSQSRSRHSMFPKENALCVSSQSFLSISSMIITTNISDALLFLWSFTYYISASVSYENPKLVVVIIIETTKRQRYLFGCFFTVGATMHRNAKLNICHFHHYFDDALF